MTIVFLIVLIINLIKVGQTSFDPSPYDHDAYGLKIAANEVLFVQTMNDYLGLRVRFAPYNYTNTSLNCALNYPDDNYFFYTVAVGSQQNQTKNSFFFVAGELLSEDSSAHNGTFIGIYINRDPQDVLNYPKNHLPINCNHFQVDHLTFLSSYQHQEHFVIGVEPYGRYAIGLATNFVFQYKPFASLKIIDIPGQQIWPSNTTFYPCAVDISETFTFIAGLVKGSAQSSFRATPTIYLMSNHNFSILSSWSYAPANNSWQARLSYSNIDKWNVQYTMSVKINPLNSTRVLVGMPFVNTVFMFVVENDGTTLRLTSTKDNGQTTGFGKSVTWLSDSQAAILDEIYSINREKYISTKIHLYMSMFNDQISTKQDAILPNIFQPIPSTIAEEWIRMVSTTSSLMILDIYGGTVLVLREQSGFYASTETIQSSSDQSFPVISHRAPCPPGTYKNDVGIHPCHLCPTGTQNSNGKGAVKCFNCSSQNFCPLGAVFELDSTLLTNLSQAYAYPKAPEMTVFEDILLQNMFSLHANAHCLVVSPLFWTMLLLIIVAILLIGMASMNLCVQREKREIWRENIKSVFQRTDLVGEGELWLGGLASLAVVLITCMAYNFAISFLNQYPAEDVGPSTFACDPTLRNAKYSSSLLALAVPISTSEQPIFDMLKNQNFTVHIDFLNTVIDCHQLSISKVVESSAIIVPLLSCANTNGTLSVSFFTPEHEGTLQIVFNTNQLVGGFRLGITSSGEKNASYTLKELRFHQTFINPTLTLATSAKFQLGLTKVINETESLSSDGSTYSGIWYPTYSYVLNNLFVSAENFMMHSTSSMTLTIVISETTYYMKNVQSPIAKQPEIIFRTLLFALLCLELIAMAFLLSKLLIIPLFQNLYQYVCRRFESNNP